MQWGDVGFMIISELFIRLMIYFSNVNKQYTYKMTNHNLDTLLTL